MKGLITFFAVFMLGFSFSRAQVQGVNDSVLENLPEIVNFDAYHFKTRFDINKDTLTLVPFDDGVVYFSWDSLKSITSGTIEYRPFKSSVWSSAKISNNALAISEIEKNVLFEYRLVIDGKKENKTRYFNSYHSSVFGGLAASEKVEKAKIMWGVNGAVLSNIREVYSNPSFVLKYNTKVGEKQNKADKE